MTESHKDFAPTRFGYAPTDLTGAESKTEKVTPVVHDYGFASHGTMEVESPQRGFPMDNRDARSAATSSLIDRLIDAAPMKCTVCSAAAGTCDCWTACDCGWYFRTDGGACRNPAHKLVGGDGGASAPPICEEPSSPSNHPKETV